MAYRRQYGPSLDAGTGAETDPGAVPLWRRVFKIMKDERLVWEKQARAETAWTNIAIRCVHFYWCQPYLALHEHLLQGMWQGGMSQHRRLHLARIVRSRVAARVVTLTPDGMETLQMVEVEHIHPVKQEVVILGML